MIFWYHLLSNKYKMKLELEVFASSQIPKLYQKLEEEKLHKPKKWQVWFLGEWNTTHYLKLSPAAAPLYSLPKGSSTVHICSMLRNPINKINAENDEKKKVV